LNIGQGEVQIIDVIGHKTCVAYEVFCSWIIWIEALLGRAIDDQQQRRDTAFQICENRLVSLLRLS